jgi:hypothetical protein
MERRIEADEPVQGLALLGTELRFGPEHDLDDIPGDEAHQDEDEDRDAQERGDEQPQAADEIPAQSVPGSPWQPPVVGRAHLSSHACLSPHAR